MTDLFKELFLNPETLGATIIGVIGIIAIVIYAMTHKTKPLEIKPAELKSEELDNLEWVLTGDERKEINKKVAIKLLFASIPALFYFIFLRIISLEISTIKYFILLYLVVVIVGLVSMYIYAFVAKPKEFRYKLTNQGIDISKGTENGEFNWADFVYFYTNVLAIQAADEKNEDSKKSGYFQQVRDIRGETYYLKLKPTGIFSKMNIVERSLVIYTKPDNYQKVCAFLLTKLPKHPAENIGFQKYYFK